MIFACVIYLHDFFMWRNTHENHSSHFPHLSMVHEALVWEKKKYILSLKLPELPLFVHICIYSCFIWPSSAVYNSQHKLCHTSELSTAWRWKSLCGIEIQGLDRVYEVIKALYSNHTSLFSYSLNANEVDVYSLKQYRVMACMQLP